MAKTKVTKKTSKVEEGLLGFDQIDDIVKAKIESIKKRNTLEDFAYRLTSRKFWLTLGVCLYFAWRGYAAAHGSFDANNNRVADIAALSAAFSSLTQVIIAFLAIQGGTDAIGRYAEVLATRQRSQDGAQNNPELNPDVINAPQNVKYGTQIQDNSNELGPPLD